MNDWPVQELKNGLFLPPLGPPLSPIFRM